MLIGLLLYLVTTYRLLFLILLFTNLTTLCNDPASGIDDCTSRPCMNGATCVIVVNSYSCICPAGYTGSRCGSGGFVLVVSLSLQT